MVLWFYCLSNSSFDCLNSFDFDYLNSFGSDYLNKFLNGHWNCVYSESLNLSGFYYSLSDCFYLSLIQSNYPILIVSTL